MPWHNVTLKVSQQRVMRMRNLRFGVQEMTVPVRVLLAAFLGLYWSSLRVEGTHRD